MLGLLIPLMLGIAWLQTNTEIAQSITATTIVRSVRACRYDDTAGEVRFTLEVTFKNVTLHAVDGTWRIGASEMFAAKDRAQAQANIWLWRFPFHSMQRDDTPSPLTALGPGEVRRVSYELSAPIGAAGSSDGLLPIAARYMFVLELSDTSINALGEPTQLEFEASLPAQMLECAGYSLPKAH